MVCSLVTAMTLSTIINLVLTVGLVMAIMRLPRQSPK